MDNDNQPVENPAWVDGLRKLQEDIHAWSKLKGWWDKGMPREPGTLLMLVVTEAAEAMEDYRHHHPATEIRYFGIDRKPEGFPTELADIVVRVFDMAAGYGIDLAEAVKIKMDYNKSRPYKHGNKAC